MDAIQATHTPEEVQQKAAGVIGPPPVTLVGALWLIVVGALVVFVLGGALAMYLLLASGKDPREVVPLMTTALGVLAGLLAPSPLSNK